MEANAQKNSQKNSQKNEKEEKGRGLSDALMGTPKERLEGKKTIYLEMIPGTRPQVTFTGFWTGRFIEAAMNSVAKAYRVRKHSASRPLNKGK